MNTTKNNKLTLMWWEIRGRFSIEYIMHNENSLLFDFTVFLCFAYTLPYHPNQFFGAYPRSLYQLLTEPLYLICRIIILFFLIFIKALNTCICEMNKSLNGNGIVSFLHICMVNIYYPECHSFIYLWWIIGMFMYIYV